VMSLGVSFAWFSFARLRWRVETNQWESFSRVTRRADLPVFPVWPNPWPMGSVQVCIQPFHWSGIRPIRREQNRRSALLLAESKHSKLKSMWKMLWVEALELTAFQNFYIKKTPPTFVVSPSAITIISTIHIKYKLISSALWTSSGRSKPTSKYSPNWARCTEFILIVNL
jgi:hypothetical protein